MASNAYLKLLDKTKCTLNYGAGNIFDHTPPLDNRERVEFLMLRIARFKVKGYSREYVTQLVNEYHTPHIFKKPWTPEEGYYSHPDEPGILNW